jgi:ABC-type multidrug transport system fused ATPase/permease subunit
MMSLDYSDGRRYLNAKVRDAMEENKVTDSETSREIGRQDYEAQTTEALARVQFQIDYSKTLFNGLTLANGGAILAILTFIGNNAGKVDPAKMMYSFSFYIAGLVLVFLAYIGAFFSQFFFYNAAQFMAWNAQATSAGNDPLHDFETEARRGNISMIAGVVCCFASLITFVCGSMSALRALT